MTVLLGVVVRYAAAALLLYAGARKIAAPLPFRQTLDALRLPAAGVLVLVVPVLEIAAAAALVAMPRSIATTVVVAGLGAAFAGAALLALHRDERIRCACYGHAGDGELGWRQLVALPVWLGVAVASLVLPAGSVSGLPQVTALALAVGGYVAVRELMAPAQRNRSYLKVLEKQR
jgi:methylamine utilization protein MauE